MNYVQHEIDSNQSLSMLVNVFSIDVNTHTYIYTQMEESRLFFRVTLYVYRLDSV